LIFRYVRSGNNNIHGKKVVFSIVGGSTDFYRALMTFGLILIVGVLVFYLIAIGGNVIAKADKNTRNRWNMENYQVLSIFIKKVWVVLFLPL
jgi:hypothetical protein